MVQFADMHNPPSEKLIVGQQLLKERQDEERRQVVMDFLDKVLQQARDAGLTVREALIFSAAFRGALEEQSGALLLSDLK